MADAKPADVLETKAAAEQQSEQQEAAAPQEAGAAEESAAAGDAQPSLLGLIEDPDGLGATPTGASDLPFFLQRHTDSKVEHWVLVANGELDSEQPFKVFRFNPLLMRNEEGSIRVAFFDESYTKTVQVGFPCHVTREWWDSTPATLGVSWDEFIASRVRIFSTSTGMFLGMIPPPGMTPEMLGLVSGSGAPLPSPQAPSEGAAPGAAKKPVKATKPAKR